MTNNQNSNKNTNISVFGIFKTVHDSDLGVSVLKDAGFSSDHLSVLLPDGDNTRQFAHESSAVGALSEALVGLGIPDYEAKRYEEFIKEGGILVSVHCSTTEKRDRAKMILENAGAKDISSTGEAAADIDADDMVVGI
jgi:hypothetical protein